MGKMIFRLLWCGVVLAALGGAVAFSAQEAVFLDGRTLSIQSHRIDADRITLYLDGGGRLTVPRSRIRVIRDTALPENQKDQQTSREPASLPPESLPVPVQAAAPPPPSKIDGSGTDLFARIADLALRNDLDTMLVTAVILVESGLDPKAESPKGAKGLMQLMPLIASHYGVENPFDPDQNLAAGISHLKVLLERYEGDLEIALAAYNAGDVAVRRYGGVPPFPETLRFIDRVLALAGAR